MKHNHVTRDIKSLGECPICDKYHEYELNVTINNYLDREDFCLCRVTNVCPSPSSHHDRCINDNCGKKINDLSYSLYTRSLDALVQVIENLGYNMYLSYSPNSKKYRARVYRFGKLSEDGDSEKKIYHKSPAMALSIALVEKINEEL